eukprot:m51a1_g1799 hypothetical protein (592) ;mRNA; r:435168-437150
MDATVLDIDSAWVPADDDDIDVAAGSWFLPEQASYGGASVYDASPSATSVSSFSPTSPPAPKCEYCMQRYEDMKDAGTAQCDAGARRWKENWDASGERCFGACTCRTFCTDHGRPLPQCLALASSAAHSPPSSAPSDSSSSAAAPRPSKQQAHSVVIYRGAWVRGKRCADVSSPESPEQALAQAQQQQQQQQQGEALEGEEAQAVREGGGPPVAKRARPTYGACGPTGECARRLRLLLATEWVRADEEARVAVAALEQRAARGECVGFCQTQYCCRLHWCPARRRPSGAPSLAGGSRYECDSGPHPQRSARKGRHQVDFPYFCGDPACCAGQWFCRDETHRRKEKRHMQQAQHQQQVAQQQMQLQLQTQQQQLQQVALQQQQQMPFQQAVFAPAGFIGDFVAVTHCESAVRVGPDPLPSAPDAPPSPTMGGPVELGEVGAAGPDDVPDPAQRVEFRLGAHRDGTAWSSAVPSLPDKHDALSPHWAAVPRDSSDEKPMQRRRAGSLGSGGECRSVASRTTSTGVSTWSVGGVVSALKAATHGSVKISKWMLTLMVFVTLGSMGALIAMVSVHLLVTEDTATEGTDVQARRMM